MTEEQKTKRVRAGVGEGETVGVTVQLPKALYEMIKAHADADERTVPHYVLRYIRDGEWSNPSADE